MVAYAEADAEESPAGETRQRVSMLKFLPYVLQAIFVVGGLSLGLWLKSGGLPSAPKEKPAAHAEAKADGHGAKEASAGHGATSEKKTEKKKAEKKKKDSHGGSSKGGHGESSKGGHGGKGGESGSPLGYLKFSRQFVVPVIAKSGVRSLVVMDINIEVPPDVTETAYLSEPKLRDSMLSVLLDLSNRGAFNEVMLDPANQENIRAELLDAARSVIGPDALSILILSIARQDV